MKVLIAEPLAEEGIARLEAEPEIEVDIILKQSPAELAKLIPAYHGLIVRSSTKVTPELLQAATNLKIVGRAGSGVDNIDLKACTAHGVVVVNTPGGNSVSVAELVIGMIIACSRKIASADRKLKQGIWAKKESKGRELNGKTLGIIGLGRIGQEVAIRARPFGMTVLGHDPFVGEGDLEKKGIQLVDFETLLAKSHFITLHVPRNDKTKYMIAKDQIAAMRDGAVVLNAARGGLIDEAALLAGLNSGKISAAGLDVYESEPEPLAELVCHDNVVATPHIGASTLEAQEQVGYYVAGFVADYLVRGVVQSAVNYPTVTAEEMRTLHPYLLVAERLGAFAAQVAVGRMHELVVTYLGDLTSTRYALLTDQVIAGGLRPFLSDADVNPINARALAEGRGLKITEATSSEACGFAGLVRVALTTENSTIEVEGAAVGEDRPPRLVTMNGLKIDAPLEGPTLFFRNDDVPGVIGRVGTYAGENGINIANFALRSDRQGGAIGVVQLDKQIAKQQRDELKQLLGIRFVRMVDLP
ncbi:MAG: phosphoglycerate dehydrogenase [Deltaproteobacteria bacterium]|nr:phosphoglycerate dehydrogenase [Deltaproteobacteria bacterium]